MMSNYDGRLDKNARRNDARYKSSMKTFVVFLFMTAMIFSLIGCAAETDIEPVTNGKLTESSVKSEEDGNSTDSAISEAKILVAYFSATGTTKEIAQSVADLLNADLYEIVPQEPYTDADLDYHDSESRTTKEMSDADSRPAIDGSVQNMESYDVIFLGYPIWHGQAPRIMSTFIESYDLGGKTIIPFCTSGSSSFGSSDAVLRSAADSAIWLDGHRFSTGAPAEEIMEWIEELEWSTANIDEEENAFMQLKIEDTVVSVEWEANESVEALKALCEDQPLEIQMSMYGGFEQVGSLGQSLPRNDVQTTTQTGDIVLYSGNQIVIFYASNSWAYTRLGRITDQTADDLARLLGNEDVTVTISGGNAE
ncbi:MAG: flavodoxin [Eubacterium sp.]|nr:flavodoxin [Eubacterium sp.]